MKFMSRAFALVIAAAALAGCERNIPARPIDYHPEETWKVSKSIVQRYGGHPNLELWNDIGVYESFENDIIHCFQATSDDPGAGLPEHFVVFYTTKPLNEIGATYYHKSRNRGGFVWGGHAEYRCREAAFGNAVLFGYY